MGEKVLINFYFQMSYNFGTAVQLFGAYYPYQEEEKVEKEICCKKKNLFHLYLGQKLTSVLLYWTTVQDFCSHDSVLMA